MNRLTTTLAAALAASALAAGPAAASDSALVREVTRDLRTVSTLASDWALCMEIEEGMTEFCLAEAFTLQDGFEEARTNVNLGWLTVGRRTACGRRLRSAALVTFNRGLRSVQAVLDGNLASAYRQSTALVADEQRTRRALAQMRRCR